MIATAKTAFNKTTTLFTSKQDKFKEETTEVPQFDAIQPLWYLAKIYIFTLSFRFLQENKHLMMIGLIETCCVWDDDDDNNNNNK